MINENETELPLTEVTYFILLSLASEPLHGYAMMKEVRLLSRDRVQLSTGTLYGALKRILDQGWIERIDEESANGANAGGRIRKAYALTEPGRQILAAEVQRLEELVAAAHLRPARQLH